MENTKHNQTLRGHVLRLRRYTKKKRVISVFKLWKSVKTRPRFSEVMSECAHPFEILQKTIIPDLAPTGHVSEAHYY